VSVGLIVAVLGTAVLVTLALLVAARRRKGGWWADPGTAAGVLGAARSTFAVILAFVILIGFQHYNNAADAAQREATATRSMFKTADLFSTRVREDIQGNVLCYSRAVVALDWPAMSHATSSERVDDLIGILDDSFRRVKAATKVQQDALSNIFDESNAAQTARSDRLTEGEDRVPVPVWVVLIIGAIGVLAYVLLFANPKENLFSQAIMVGATTVILVGGLMLVWFLSHPYRDQPGSIRPTAMEKTLAELQSDPSYAESGLVTGCDAQGNQLTPANS
jgi:hypothetical protein